MRRELSLAVTLALLLMPAAAQTLGCVNAGAGGIFPTAGTGDGAYQTVLPSAPGVFPMLVGAVPPGATNVTEVRLLGATHTFINDLQFVLTDPNGDSYVLWNRINFGATAACDLLGDYTILPTCTAVTNPFPTSCPLVGVAIPPGNYVQHFGNWVDGNHGFFNRRLDSAPAITGVWTLTVYDWVINDVGALVDWQLCFGNPLPPLSGAGAPSITYPANNAQLDGARQILRWTSEPCYTPNYEVEVDGLIYPTTSTELVWSGPLGLHSFRVRTLFAGGASDWSAMRSFTTNGPPPSACNGGSIETLFDAGGSGGSSVVYFDANVLAPGGITVRQLDLMLLQQPPGSPWFADPIEVEIWTRNGTHAGAEQSAAGWTLASMGYYSWSGQPGRAVIDVFEFHLDPGLNGLCVFVDNPSDNDQVATRNTLGAFTVSNADVELTFGSANTGVYTTPFGGPVSAGVVWNGALRYNCAPAGPVAYCTSGASSSGCSPRLYAPRQPSASLSTPCEIYAAFAESQRTGLLFYGLTASAGTPWTPNSTSFKCVKGPTQRMFQSTPQGAAGSCEALFRANWNSFITARPNSLGTPFAAGVSIYLQGWYRDPPAPKSISLTDALVLTFQP